MANLMPQEVEVWYLIPALRREIAKILVNENKISQKEASNILGLTESAISQYLKEKRAKEIIFSEKDIKKIRIYTKKMIKDKSKSIHYLYLLSKQLKKKEIICEVHKKYDKKLSNNCKICFKN